MLKDIINGLPDIGESNICVALSGGLDSTTLAYALVHKYGAQKVKAISFDFGQRHTVEIDMATATAVFLGIDHDIIRLDYLADIARETSALIEGSELNPKTAEENAGDPQVNTYVPFRNMQFAAITSAYAEAKGCSHIAQGLNAVDQYGYWDTTLEFTERINDVLNLNRGVSIQFIAPFVELHKDDELIIAKELSNIFNTDILKNTWSCYNGITEESNYKECGVCNTCVEKLTGYVLADYSDSVILDKFNITSEELVTLKGQM